MRLFPSPPETEKYYPVCQFWNLARPSRQGLGAQQRPRVVYLRKKTAREKRVNHVTFETRVVPPYSTPGLALTARGKGPDVTGHQPVRPLSLSLLSSSLVIVAVVVGLVPIPVPIPVAFCFAASPPARPLPIAFPSSLSIVVCVDGGAFLFWIPFLFSFTHLSSSRVLLLCFT